MNGSGHLPVASWLACSVCFGGEASTGGTVAVLFLLAVVVTVEIAVGRFFYRLVRRGGGLVRRGGAREESS